MFSTKENTSQHILGSQYYYDSKTRQAQHTHIYTTDQHSGLMWIQKS